MFNPAAVPGNSFIAASPATESSIGMLLHRDGVVVDADEETASIFGCTREQLVGMLVADLIVVPADSGDEASAKARSRTGEDIPIQVVRRRRRADGE